jgi:hypothetical protein
MCQLHPSSIYHFPVEVLFDFSGSSKASVVPPALETEVIVGQSVTVVQKRAGSVEECDSFEACVCK